MKPVLPLWVLLAASVCSVVQAQPAAPPRIAFDDVTVTRLRGITSIRLRGSLSAAITGQAPLQARLTRGEAVAMTAPVEVEDGQGRIRFRTARLLLDGRYTVELVAKGATACTALVQVGADAEVVAARARLMRWYQSAAGTLRQLTATLERRGRFHLALTQAKVRTGHEQAFNKEFLPDWNRALRVAAMDLATYRRRLLLPYRPELGQALRALLPLLQARRDAWQTAIVGETKRGVDPGPNERLEGQAEALLKLLGRPAGELNQWRAGILGEPPSLPKPGAHTDKIGFSITIPDGAQVLPPVNPVDRLTFRFEKATVIVRVVERPDERTPKELREAVELGAWERWDSFKLLTSKARGDQGVRLEYTARLRTRDRTAARAGATARVIQVTRFAKASGRTLSLILVRAEGRPLPKALAALEAAW